MNKKKLFFLKLFVSATIFTFLIYKIGIGKIILSLSKINIVYIPLIIVLCFLSLVCGSYNIRLLLKPVKTKLRFWRLYKYYSLSWALGLFVPGRFGEFSLVYFLSKEDVQLGKGSAVFIMDKLITFVIIFVLSVAGLFVFPFFSATRSLEIVFVLLLCLLVALFFLFHNKGRFLIKRYILRSWSNKFHGFSAFLFNYIKNYKTTLLFNFLLTLLRLFIQALVILLLFIAIGEYIPIIIILIIRSIIIILSFIPISLNNLGIRESAAVFLYSRIGVGSDVTAAVYIALLILNYLIAFFFILFFLDKKGVSLKNN